MCSSFCFHEFFPVLRNLAISCANVGVDNFPTGRYDRNRGNFQKVPLFDDLPCYTRHGEATMTTKEFHEGLITLVRCNRIFAVLHADSNELCFYSDKEPCRFAIPESLTERQVKVLLVQPKRSFIKM